MSIIEDVSKLTGLPYDSVLTEFSVKMYSSSVLVVSNFISILSYSDLNIIFKLKNNLFSVNGEDLKIIDLDKKDAVICGKFKSMEYSR